MTRKELEKLISRKESDRLDFKRSTGQRSDGAKTVCAMLNGLGGFVLFGVTDEGEINGQMISDSTLKDISEEFQKIEPPVFPEMEIVNLKDDKGVIVVSVAGGGGPYTYNGRPYSRQGPTTVKMPQQRYERLLLERMHGSQRWENQRAHGFSLEDLDSAEITKTVKEAIRRNRLRDPGTRDPIELLRGLSLVDARGNILNSAVVLFAKNDHLLPDFPQCLLKMARFRGTDKTEFLDNRQEYGNAFELLQRAQRFFIDHIPVAGHIEPDRFERVDEPLFPPEALREAVSNAICHRDYSFAGGSVAIALYDDRLEISNTGVLPFDLTPEKLFLPHASHPWNPLIAQAFYRRGIIEAWGRGTIKMRELTLAAGLPEPEVKCGCGEVVVRFFLPRGKTLSTFFLIGKSDSTSRGTSQLEDTKLDLYMKILHILRENSKSMSTISRELGQHRISGTLKLVVIQLRKDGCIEYTIPRKPKSRLQQYRITEKGRIKLTGEN